MGERGGYLRKKCWLLKLGQKRTREEGEAEWEQGREGRWRG